MKRKIKYMVTILLLSFPQVANATEPETTCNTLLGAKATDFLLMILLWIQIGGIVLAIILGMTDFMGAILSGENDSNKKSLKKLIIRVAMAATLLIVPAILKVVLTVFGISSDGLCII